jgi:hypothetical protein
MAPEVPRDLFGCAAGTKPRGETVDKIAYGYRTNGVICKCFLQ